MLQKKPKIFCDLSVLAIHSSIPVENQAAGVILLSFCAVNKVP
jgi:ACT domain-containing protein